MNSRSSLTERTAVAMQIPRCSSSFPAAVAHKRAYDPITGLSVEVETPGACTNRLDLLTYRRLARLIFPLDAMNMPRFAEAKAKEARSKEERAD
jgi:hypothetical protein